MRFITSDESGANIEAFAFFWTHFHNNEKKDCKATFVVYGSGTSLGRRIDIEIETGADKLLYVLSKRQATGKRRRNGTMREAAGRQSPWSKRTIHIGCI